MLSRIAVISLRKLGASAEKKIVTDDYSFLVQAALGLYTGSAFSCSGRRSLISGCAFHSSRHRFCLSGRRSYVPQPYAPSSLSFLLSRHFLPSPFHATTSLSSLAFLAVLPPPARLFVCSCPLVTPSLNTHVRATKSCAKGTKKSLGHAPKRLSLFLTAANKHTMHPAELMSFYAILVNRCLIDLTCNA